MKTTVSIIILNFNGLEHTRACLLSLSELDFPADQLEIIVVDNGSSDGSTDVLKSEFPHVSLIENEANLGFSQAANQGAAEAKGEYLAFLNNDMRVAKDWLKAMLEVVRPDEGIVCAGSMILNWEGTEIDFMGRPDDAFCLQYDRSEILASPADLPFPDKYELFVSGGAAIFQARAFHELGGFDPNFFLYQEDVDLGWRLWLRGYKAVMSSRSVVFHKSGASSGKLPKEFVYKLNRKHTLFSLFKNLEKKNLSELFPIILYYFIERSRLMPRGHEAVAGAIQEFESSLDSLVAIRQEVQRTRVRSDAELISLLGNPFKFLFDGQDYESARARLAEYPLVKDFDPTRADEIRAALGSWLNAAHLECERFLLTKTKALEDEIQAADTTKRSLVNQVSERQGAVEALAVQLSERHESVLALTEQVAERQRAVEVPTAQLRQREQDLTILAAQIAEQQKTIRRLSTQLEENERARAEDVAQKLALQLAETEQKYTGEIVRQEKAIEIISAQLEMRQSQLDKITSNFGWRVLSRYGQFKYAYLLPLYRLLRLQQFDAKKPRQLEGSSDYPTKFPEPEQSLISSAPISPLSVPEIKPQEEHITTSGPEEFPKTEDWQTHDLGSGEKPESVQLSKAEVLARASEEWLPIKLRAAQELIRLINVHSGVRGIVVFPQTIGWDINLFQRPQQIALSLARQNYLVLYHTADELDGHPEFQRMAERLYLCYAPFEVFGFLEAPIVFALHYNREQLRHLQNATVVYEMIDELEVFDDKPERLERNHTTLLKRAALVCVTADRLLEKVKPLRPDAILVPNAVDYEHFEPARKRHSHEVPVPLRSLVAEGKPIVGYYGAHARWVDYELLRYAAKQRPDLNFLLIGPDHEETLRASQLTSLPNVRWVGPRPYQELPHYLRYFDVAIIPFVVDNITLSVSPLKLFEYLAAGKPVVTSDLPECRKYPLVLVAADRDQFVSHLDKALQLTEDMSYRVAAMRVAKDNTWDERVKTILKALNIAGLNPRSNFELEDAELSELVTLLTYEVNEHKKTIATLMVQVGEKEEQAKNVIASWAGLEQARENAIRERDEVFREKEIVEREKEIVERGKEIVEREKEIVEREKEIVEREKEVVERERDKVSARLDQITGTLAWRLLNHYGRIKYKYLLPLYRMMGQRPELEPASQNGATRESVLQSVRTKIEETSSVAAAPTAALTAAPTVALTAAPTAAPTAATTPPGAYDVVVFPIIDWAFRFQRPQQLATQFARDGHRVFYLRTTFHQGGAAANAIGIAERIYDVQVPGPAYMSIYRDEINKRLLNELLNAIDQFRRVNMIEEAVCIVQLPFWTPLALAAQQRWGWKVIYDCMDEHSGFSTNAATMLQHEETLVAESDLLVTSSQKLHDKLAAASERCLMLPNATDFEHFSEPGPLRPLRKLRGPIIGYYGAISDWFDVEMVHHAAATRPDWQFVLVGDTFGADVSSLKRLSNVHLLGEQPYEAIPGYLHQFDVGIIPFLLTPLTESTNPVKFYEYLSAGKPVVSTELRELKPYRDHFYAVSSREDFVTQIETALRENSPEKIQARIELARQNTWLDRYESLSTAVGELYGKAVIIIVSFKNREYLWLCLEHLWAKTLYPNYEVIVVDNGSDPKIIEYLKESQLKHPQLNVILNGENLGFARANNIGIEAAGDCDYVVLLNDDTIVTRHWLTRLLRHLKDKPVGLIGPVTNNIGNEGRIEVDYEIVEYKDVDVMEEFAQARTRENVGRSFDIPMLAMYCVAMRKSILDEVGLLDEQFGVGMFEDDDFSMRVRQAGYRIVCAEDVFIHHWGRASFNQIDKKAYYQLFDENKAKFEAKWKRKWDPHKSRRSSGTAQSESGPASREEIKRFEWNEQGQMKLLVDGFRRFENEYNSFPLAPTDNPNEFHLNNPSFDGTDALVLYCMIRHFRPNTVAVVDSGFALRLCVQAASRNGNTRVICIAGPEEPVINDPGLIGTLSQNPPEDILDVVHQLKGDDILFFGSNFLRKIHEDVNYPLLDVFPRLKPGVITHLHGIFMPQEFPKEWMAANPEAWGLECALQIFLASNPHFEVLFSNSFMASRNSRELITVFPKSPWTGGGSFWMRRQLG